MERAKKLCLLLAVFTMTSPSGVHDGAIASNADFFSRTAIITNVYVTAYCCVYNSELAGTQTVTMTISNVAYTLKASFLFGGWGPAMQGTGRTGPGGDYIKYTGGAGCFVRLDGPNAGRDLEGRWIINPEVLRCRYARLGVTDFTGFGNLALLYPDCATYSLQSLITGSTGRPLTPWLSISADPSLIPTGQTGTLVFKADAPAEHGLTQTSFTADDTGGSINGKHIDIYLGEGRSAIDEWYRTGGNRYVDIYPVR